MSQLPSGAHTQGLGTKPPAASPAGSQPTLTLENSVPVSHDPSPVGVPVALGLHIGGPHTGTLPRATSLTSEGSLFSWDPGSLPCHLATLGPGGGADSRSPGVLEGMSLTISFASPGKLG